MAKIVRIFAALLILTLALMLAVAGGQRIAQADTLVVDDNGVECPGAPYGSVSAAVAAAASGDTISICAGTYVEQVLINKSLIMQGAGASTTTIKAPGALAADGAGDTYIVEIAGVGVSVEMSDLTVSGPGPGGCGSITFGAIVRDGAMANLHDAQFLDVRDNPLSGCQNGWALVVGRNPFDSGTSTATATIADNAFAGFQKGGIAIVGNGSSAIITGNTVTGAGETSVNIAQDGIAVWRQATATIQGNEVTGMGDLDVGGTGIVLIGGKDVLIEANQIHDNYPGTGIFTIGGDWFGNIVGLTSGAVIRDNDINNNWPGIAMGHDSEDISIDENDLTGNNQAIRFEVAEWSCSGCTTPPPTGVLVTGNTIKNNSGINAAIRNRLGANGVDNHINYNCIEGNAGGVNPGGANNEDSSVVLDGEHNWWGDASGPSGAGPGSGDSVSANVDFTPWLTAPPVGSGCAPALLDHFKCYEVDEQEEDDRDEHGGPSFSSRREREGRTVYLKDQFNTSYVRASVSSPELLCNPAAKTLEGGDPGEILHPEAHLVCYKEKQARFQPRTVHVADQFIDRDVRVTDPIRLCLPSLKTEGDSLQLDGLEEVEAILDHYNCYSTRRESFDRVRNVTLEDQFHTEVVDVLRPLALCNPALKSLEGNEGNGELVNEEAHLMCYQIKEVSANNHVEQASSGNHKHREVTVLNQFGERRLRVGEPRLLCNPAVKTENQQD